MAAGCGHASAAITADMIGHIANSNGSMMGSSDGCISIFLADDHAMIREALAALMARNSDLAVVGQCGHGSEVLGQVEQLKPDVVLLDITMPGMNGLDVCRLLTRKLKHPAVLMLTMHDDEEIIATALRNGACGYLLKEAASAQLAEAVRAVARGELVLGSGISKGVLSRMAGVRNDPYDQLTTRERQVLQLIAEGRTNREIAGELKVALKTVDTHRSHLMRKLDIHDQTTLVKYALRKGIVPLN